MKDPVINEFHYLIMASGATLLDYERPYTIDQMYRITPICYYILTVIDKYLAGFSR